MAKQRDRVLWALVLLSSLVSGVAYWIVARAGTVLAYNDAISHMEIARRVFNSNNTGFAQLGNVWLPLPHVLILPFVGFDELYYSGFAGAILSMVSFVVCCAMIYKTLLQLTGKKLPGVAGAIVFAVNVNVLYMQSTPMTELPLFAALLVVVYCLQVWTDTYRYTYLVGAGVAAIAATLTRYEAWPILGVLAVVVFIAMWRAPQGRKLSSKENRARTFDHWLVFAVVGFAGIAFWFLWNQFLFGSLLGFKNGEYAKPSLWLTSSEPAIGNLELTAKTFWYACLETIPWPLLIAAALGLGAFIFIEMERGKLNARSFVIPSLLVLVPFFLWAIYTGERPLHVMQVNGGLYNVRFALIMVIPVALLAGYLVGVFRKLPLLAIVAVVGLAGVSAYTSYYEVQRGHVITLNDPIASLKEDRAVWAAEASRVFAGLYVNSSSDVLMETFGNERFAFQAVPSDKLVYEGTNKGDRWERSLRSPLTTNIGWIVARCIPGYQDKVCDAMRDTPDRLTGYTLVGKTDSGYFFYKRS